MGIMQDNLNGMMQKYYSLHENAERITKAALSISSFDREIQAVYKALGGVLDSYPVNVGKFDVTTSKVLVELDEHLHFNRYRSVTLKSTVYENMTTFPVELYQDFCVMFEERCLSAGGYGGKWTNPSCEKQFGIAANPKDLRGNGAPRWKQRAFYDFIKDVGCYVQKWPLVRISIYDKVETDKDRIQLYNILNRNLTQYAEGVYKLIESRY